MKRTLGKKVYHNSPCAQVLRWCSCITVCEREGRNMETMMNLLTSP